MLTSPLFKQSLLGLFLLFQVGFADAPMVYYGTDVRVVLPDLITVVAVGYWQDNSLVLTNPLEPGRDVRVLISDPNTGMLLVPKGYVTSSGRDIFIERIASFNDAGLSLQSMPSEPSMPQSTGYASLRTILARQGMNLLIPVHY